GRFVEVGYWDWYFSMLGLVQSGRTDLVKSMLDNFAYLITQIGHIPNGNRTYYLTRSQPPYFAAMVGLFAHATDTSQALPYLDALEKEYAFWMDGAESLQPGQFYRRVVRMPDGTILNRYWDDTSEPRPESYRPDVEIGQTLPDSQRASFYRTARATAESGWDFSSRWMRDPKDLRTLETTELIPVDLNSLLYNAEHTIAALRAFRHAAGDADVARRFTQLAERRLEWLAIEGVRRYGRSDLADNAARRWLTLLERTYHATGSMKEKYDVVHLNKKAGGGEYPTQDGFGWTNGVALALCAHMAGTCKN